MSTAGVPASVLARSPPCLPPPRRQARLLERLSAAWEARRGVSGLGQRVDAFRSLRAKVEASVLPLATSVDGRRFSFQAGVNGLALRLGGYAMLEGDGEGSLAQVRSLALTEVDLGETGHAAEQADDLDLRTRLRIRIARGEGVLLDRGA